jgi:thiamine-phosphate pyrophosphorylase
VWETPTKEGRPAAGLAYVREAADLTAGRDVPWFAIGGIDLDNVREVTAAGASRIVVVRAIRDAPDPRAAAAELRAVLGDGQEHA